jgi:succinate-semialdehyde dehydrogenase / glutarate-semialdehyde dehydrogenase
MKSINPATGKMIKEYPEHSLSEVKEILNLTQEAWESWKLTSFVERAVFMKQTAKLLRQRNREFARLITDEMGKLITESEAEVEKSALVCDYYAEHAERFLSDEHIASDGSDSFAAFEPLGVVLAVMPWNFPFWQVFRFAAPALMAGNGAVLKHASNVPGCALVIEAIFREAGLPASLFRSLMIPGKSVKEVIANGVIKAVTLTGSEAAGSHVAETAGKYLKKTVLELGGSDPFIVLADAYLATCTKTAVAARMINCGQSCIAAKRFIVEKDVAPRFIQMVKDELSALKPINPADNTVGYAPMARPDLVDDLLHQIEKSIEMGAKIMLGGKRLEREGYYFEPTLITEVTEDMPVFSEETFGPVLPVLIAENYSEAIRIANNSPFGLGASLWTEDVEKGIRLAREIESGAVFINGMVKSDPRLPFGGIKRSGFGRELSHYGIKEFVNIKTIWVK